jgi:hypothetical protein
VNWSIYTFIIFLIFAQNIAHAMETSSALDKIFYHFQSNLLCLGKKSPKALLEILKLVNIAKENGIPKEEKHLSINEKTGYYSAHFGHASNQEFIITTRNFNSITKNNGYFVSLDIKFADKKKMFGYECRKCSVTFAYFSDSDIVELIVNFGEQQWVDKTRILATEIERKYQLDDINKNVDWESIPFLYQKTSKYIYYDHR